MILVLSCFAQRAALAQPPAAPAAEFFEKEVRPLLANRCFKCHGDAKPKGGLRLTSRKSLLAGGDSGPAAVAGKPAESLLIQAVGYKDTPQMPPKGKLPAREIAALTRWVELGLPWPAANGPSHSTAAKAGQEYQISPEQRRFWSFQPVHATTPPAVKNASWPRSDIDRFILAGLEAKGLQPAAAADRRTLIRRATFDLTGLPPTPEEIEAFLNDRSPEAFARVVDRLLASPQYGERWGRHWLDVVRYADSGDIRGLGTDVDSTEAYRYRDWVVDAFNRDLPYNQFVIEQIAGDLLPAQRPGQVNAPGLIATGVLAIGEWGTGDADKEKMMTDIVNDQVDVVSRAFMGLTVACARCHDHKFDPIPTKDYYGLAGIFFSTHIIPTPGPKTNGSPLLRVPLVPQAELERVKRHTAHVVEWEKALKAAADVSYRASARRMLPQTARYMMAAWELRNRPAGQARVSAGEFAARRGLNEAALGRWLDFLGLDTDHPLTVLVRNLSGKSGVYQWKGTSDTSSATVNTNPAPVSILSYTLPPKSVAVHPGPANGVAIAWKSPIAGTVRISGKVADADPNCGDGIAWFLDRRDKRGGRELVSGALPNGGAQKFGPDEAAADMKQLAAVEVKPGETIRLVVLPKANHSCDTTHVELVVAERGGSAVWDLSRDLVADFLREGEDNLRPKRPARTDVWQFSDTSKLARGKGLGPDAEAALARWHRAAAGVTSAALKQDALEEAARAFQKAFHADDSESPFWIASLREAERVLPPAEWAVLAKQAAELEALKKNVPPPIPYALAAQEGGVPQSKYAGIHDARVHIRGSYQRLGDVVPRHFPRIIAGDRQAPIRRGSGRLELARWLTSPDHPLTARVMVNRIWQHHFGAGIVRTPSNFGKMGERPSHPELLDSLARRFVEGGWSIKALHRAIMLSATYQQASEPNAEGLKADPDNRLFGRMNRRRLEAEEIRDSLLAVAGRLDRTRGGPATRDFFNPRRTLYSMTIRSDRSGFGPLFDSADALASVDVRTVSTVAPQALFLLNHPFVLERTKDLANRVAGEVPGAERVRIARVYNLLYGRPPTDEETQIGLEFLARAGHDSDPAASVSVASHSPAGAGERAWLEYCQILLCANEMITID